MYVCILLVNIEAQFPYLVSAAMLLRLETKSVEQLASLDFAFLVNGKVARKFLPAAVKVKPIFLVNRDCMAHAIG